MFTLRKKEEEEEEEEEERGRESEKGRRGKKERRRRRRKKSKSVNHRVSRQRQQRTKEEKEREGGGSLRKMTITTTITTTTIDRPTTGVTFFSSPSSPITSYSVSDDRGKEEGIKQSDPLYFGHSCRDRKNKTKKKTNANCARHVFFLSFFSFDISLFFFLSLLSSEYDIFFLSLTHLSVSIYFCLSVCLSFCPCICIYVRFTYRSADKNAGITAISDGKVVRVHPVEMLKASNYGRLFSIIHPSATIEQSLQASDRVGKDRRYDGLKKCFEDKRCIFDILFVRR